MTLAVLQSTEVIDIVHKIHLIYHEANGVTNNLIAMIKNLRAMTLANLPITSERVYKHP